MRVYTAPYSAHVGWELHTYSPLRFAIALPGDWSRDMITSIRRRSGAAVLQSMRLWLIGVWVKLISRSGRLELGASFFLSRILGLGVSTQP